MDVNTGNRDDRYTQFEMWLNIDILLLLSGIKYRKKNTGALAVGKKDMDMNTGNRDDRYTQFEMWLNIDILLLLSGIKYKKKIPKHLQ